MKNADALRAFARLYGYVRFFHPSDEAAAVDWQRFAVHGAGRVLKTSDRDALKAVLEELFLPIAPTVRVSVGRPARGGKPEIPPRGVRSGPVVAWQHEGLGSFDDEPSAYHSIRVNRRNRIVRWDRKVRITAKPLFPKLPGIGEATVKPLGSGLWCRVPLALRDSGGRTWGPPSPYPLSRLRAALGSMKPGRLVPERSEVRAAAVIVAWNVFQHFYPYFDVVKVDWDAVLKESLERALGDSGRDDFLLTLRLLVAKLGDGHGNVWPKGGSGKRGYLPFCVDWVEGRVVVTGAAAGSGFRRGDVVVSVDGKRSAAIVREAMRHWSGSEQWRRFHGLLDFMHGRPGSKARVAVRRNGRLIRATARRYPEWLASDEAIEHPAIWKPRAGVFCVNLDKASMKEIDARMGEIATARGVVFDLRGYPNENDAVINHLLRRARTSQSWMRIPRIIYPDRERIAGWDRSGWSMKPRNPHIRGRVVFLTDGRAISYAESFMGFIEGYKLGEIVGQPTAGTNGNINPFPVPGGYRICWTGMKVVKHDGSRLHLVGIRPTIPVNRTIRGVRDGRDEFLERALVEIG